MLAWLELTTGLPVRLFQLGHGFERSPGRARAQQRVGLGPADLRRERHHFLGVVVVDLLVAAGGGVRLALDVEDLEAERLEVGTELFVVPVRVGRGDRDLARAEGAQGLDDRRAGGHRRDAGRLVDDVEHLAIPARATIEATGRAAVGDDVDARGGQIARAGFDLGVHAVHARGAHRVVGQPQALAVNGDVARAHQLEVRLEAGVGRGNHHADSLAHAHAGVLLASS